MRRAPGLPRLHLVTDDRVVAAPAFREIAAAVITAGGGDLALQLRAPGASGRALYEAAAALVPVAAASGALLLVNGRADVARAAGAGGVQLPRRGIPPEAARRVMGAAAVIGASVHSPAEAREAGGADFLLAGTIFRSGSHPDRPPAGTSLIRELLPIGRPVIAIGGITPDRVPEVLAAGASGVAVLAAVWDAGDPVAAVLHFLETLREME